jgi:hypothetical protein
MSDIEVLQADIRNLQSASAAATTAREAAEAERDALRREADEDGNVLFDSLNDATSQLERARAVLDPRGAAPTLALDVLATSLFQVAKHERQRAEQAERLATQQAAELADLRRRTSSPNSRAARPSRRVRRRSRHDHS